MDVKEQVNSVGFALKKRGVKFRHGEHKGMPVIAVQFGGGFSFPGLTVYTAFDRFGRGFHIDTSPVAVVPKESSLRGLEVANWCNSQYRWAKFFLNEKSEIVVSADALFGECNAGDVYENFVWTLVRAVDAAYPAIMKAIWE